MQRATLLVVAVLALGLAPVRAAEPPEPAEATRKRVAELVEKLDDEDASVRAGAAEALVKLGPKAKGAVPALVKALGDKDERVLKPAGRALIEIGPPAIPALVNALGEKDSVRPGVATAVLGRMGPPAVPALVRALGEKDDYRTQFLVTTALGVIGPAAVRGLTEALGAPDPGLRERAAHALAMICDPDAEEAVPALVKALEDKNPKVRMTAASALGGIGSAAREAIPALERALQDKDENVRACAAVALKEIRLGWWRGPGLAVLAALVALATAGLVVFLVHRRRRAKAA